MIAERIVAVHRAMGAVYPNAAPFDPPYPYPEYLFAGAAGGDNAVYGAVREVLHLAGLDAPRFGTPEWNPLGALVHRGGCVLIKPNWVRHYHLRGLDVFSIITHPSVLRPLIDYAFKAVGPAGRIYLMDAPQFDSDFAAIEAQCQLEQLTAALRGRGVPLVVADLRSLVVKTDHGVVVERIKRDSWECEGVEFDLGDHSELAELDGSLGNLFGSDYDRRATVAFHTRRADGRQRHCYRVARRVLEADLVVSVPKLKTHKKTGVTLNVKNMIGINTDKNYIPHYRVGSPGQGGDEFPETNSLPTRLKRAVVRRAVDTILGRMGSVGERAAHTFMTCWLALNTRRAERRAGQRLDPVDVFYRSVQGDTYRTGNWWGNDTCWRSALDLNKILLYGTYEGRLAAEPVRRYFSVIDGIVGGDEDGPMAPTPRPEGVLIAGHDPISVDTVATQVMGFDPALMRDQRRGTALARHWLTDNSRPMRICSNWPAWDGAITRGSDLGFRPHFAWADYLRRVG